MHLNLPGVFQVYDLNRDGTIAYDEMLQIVRSVYLMVGRMAELPEDEKTPEKVRFTKSVSKAGICTDKNGLGW